MAVSKKLRFDVLSRDWHCCMYCGRKPPYVMLEVDHIVSKKKWWSDTMDNLKTSCFDCNRGKWWETREESNWKMYKKKIDSTKVKLKNYLYTQWNSKYMWTIDKNTFVLLRFYIDTIVNEDKVKENISIDNFLNWDSKDYSLFILWWDHCDSILERIYNNWKDTIDNIIEYVYDENNWCIENSYNTKINYHLTEELSSLYKEDNWYVIRKFSLHPYILQ